MLGYFRGPFSRLVLHRHRAQTNWVRWTYAAVYHRRQIHSTGFIFIVWKTIAVVMAVIILIRVWGVVVRHAAISATVAVVVIGIVIVV